jgi:hypothetical protein
VQREFYCKNTDVTMGKLGKGREFRIENVECRIAMVEGR